MNQLHPEEPARVITIRGLPVYSGALLSVESSAFHSLRTIFDFARFARALRGQFCITVRDGSQTIAITDFGCSRPVFYYRDPVTLQYRVSPRLNELIPYSAKQVSREALFFYVARGGIGISPFYSDIQELHAATVACFSATRLETVVYLEWESFLVTQPIDAHEAERQLIAIASNYLGAIVRESLPVACLLSGGTDSALVAWLLQSIGCEPLCFTADYKWKRYSEFSGAEFTAAALSLRQERVLIHGNARSVAFAALNSKKNSGPCCDALAPVMYQVASAALGQGIQTLITGDHADSLFLGFDRLFAAFPRDAAGYERATAALTGAQKLALLYPPIRSAELG